MSEQPGVWTGPTEGADPGRLGARRHRHLGPDQVAEGFRVPNGNRVVLFQIEQVPDCQVASA